MFSKSTRDSVSVSKRDKVPSKLCVAIKSFFCKKKAPVSTPTSHAGTHPDQGPPSVDDFEILLLLGRGGTSSVYMVRERKTRALYALKQAPKSCQSADLAQEQLIMKCITELPDSPRSLLPLVGSWSDDQYFYLLTPWCGGKDLSSLAVNSQQLGGDRVKMFMAELVVAVEALHNLGYIHRDIKPANVFLTKEGHVVLGDFGFAKRLNSGESDLSFDADPNASSGSFLKPGDVSLSTQERCGTLHWMSPSQHAGSPYAFDADMWALGLLMFKMSTGRLPFGNRADTTDEVHTAYANDPIELAPTDPLDDMAKDLIAGLLRKDPRTRTTIPQMKAHKYFAGVDWEAVARHESPVSWVPREPFIPEHGRPKLLSPGVPYKAGADPHPAFAFVAPSFLKRPPGPLKALAQRIARCFRKTNMVSIKRKNEGKTRVYEVKLAAQSASSLEKNGSVCGSDTGGSGRLAPCSSQGTKKSAPQGFKPSLGQRVARQPPRQEHDFTTTLAEHDPHDPYDPHDPHDVLRSTLLEHDYPGRSGTTTSSRSTTTSFASTNTSSRSTNTSFASTNTSFASTTASFASMTTSPCGARPPPLRVEHLLREHDHLLCEHEHLLTEHEHLLREHEDLLCEHDDLLCEHDHLLCEHEHLLREHEHLLTEHEDLLCEQEHLLCEQEHLLREHDHLLESTTLTTLTTVMAYLPGGA
ncbi:kinase-like domain-containing protein [Mycena crocata]|nr:kinase-like domain-containing protein [Mycena crocata]